MLEIDWPATLPVPTPQQEEAVRPYLLRGSAREWKRFEPVRSLDLPHARRREISAAAAAHGMRLEQALSLRTVLLKDAVPWKYYGTEASSLEAADAFEAAAERHLARLGVRFVTQAQQQARLVAQGVQGQGVPTPDFLFLEAHPGCINGARVSWLESKHFYGAGATDVRAWAAPRKAVPQARRYLNAFGPGAVLFISGYSCAMRSWLPPEIQLLDGGCVDLG